uniref:Uncharacterized protein n=1 Tax=Physcomitrium patens TaxID=3218 RepID=A0A2K1IS11_PHYPA|nr:hypothetical protein PHYPA_026194 [Physcomitrium patens]
MLPRRKDMRRPKEAGTRFTFTSVPALRSTMSHEHILGNESGSKTSFIWVHSAPSFHICDRFSNIVKI